LIDSRDALRLRHGNGRGGENQRETDDRKTGHETSQGS
jgi:hypothetical protein